MKNPSSVLFQGALLAPLSLLWFVFLAGSVGAQEPAASPVSTPAESFVYIANATGLPGEVAVEVDGKTDAAMQIPMGGYTGMNSLAPGTYTLKFSRDGVASVEHKLTLKMNERANLLIHVRVTPGEGGGAPAQKLEVMPLTHQPTPGKKTLTLLNCDAMGRTQELALNGEPFALEPLKALHIAELPDAAQYSLTFKGVEIMAPYQPLVADHAYLIVYADLVSPRLNGILVSDRKRGTLEEEMDYKKKEVAQRIAREKAAAEWVLKELDRRTQERAEARAQRQRQGGAVPPQR